MKYEAPENCGCSKKCLKEGYEKVPETNELEEGPSNVMWPEDVGGFLPRPNGWER